MKQQAMINQAMAQKQKMTIVLANESQQMVNRMRMGYGLAHGYVIPVLDKKGKPRGR